MLCHACGSEGTASGSLLSPCTMCVPGTELGLLGLATVPRVPYIGGSGAFRPLWMQHIMAGECAGAQLSIFWLGREGEREEGSWVPLCPSRIFPCWPEHLPLALSSLKSQHLTGNQTLTQGPWGHLRCNHTSVFSPISRMCASVVTFFSLRRVHLSSKLPSIYTQHLKIRQKSLFPQGLVSSGLGRNQKRKYNKKYE